MLGRREKRGKMQCWTKVLGRASRPMVWIQPQAPVCSKGCIPVGHPQQHAAPQQHSVLQVTGGMWPGRQGLTVKGSSGGCGIWSRHWNRRRMTSETCTKVTDGVGRGRHRNPTPQCQPGVPAKLSPSLPSPCSAQPQSTHAIGMPRLWLCAHCTPATVLRHRADHSLQKSLPRRFLQCLRRRWF